MALIVRTRFNIEKGTQAWDEWIELERGVRNNCPSVIDELFPSRSAAQRKRDFRQAFGRELGDVLRHEGGGVSDIGPQAQGMIIGFISKLTRSLYYHHVGKVFQGDIFIRHYNLMQFPDPKGLLESLVALAPQSGQSKRSGKLLHDQFFYRFNYTDDGSIFFCVVQFSEQMVFHMMAMDFCTSVVVQEAQSQLEDGYFGEKVTIRLGD